LGQIPVQSVEFDCQIQYMSIDFSRKTNSVHGILSCSFANTFNPNLFPKLCFTFLSQPRQLSLIDSCQDEQSPSDPVFLPLFLTPPLLFKINSLGANSTRGVLLGILGWGVPPGSPNPDPFYFRPKNVIFHTRFQTRPLKSIPVFRPGL